MTQTYEEYLNDDIYNIDPGWDISDGWEYVDFLIENLTKEPIPREVPEEYIDQIVKDEDYMEFRAYLERIADDTELIKKVMEYVEFNYPEFSLYDTVVGDDFVVVGSTEWD